MNYFLIFVFYGYFMVYYMLYESYHQRSSDKLNIYIWLYLVLYLLMLAICAAYMMYCGTDFCLPNIVTIALSKSMLTYSQPTIYIYGWRMDDIKGAKCRVGRYYFLHCRYINFGFMDFHYFFGITT